jgi:hypothetical protein
MGLKLPVLSVKTGWLTLVVNDLKRISCGIPAESWPIYLDRVHTEVWAGCTSMSPDRRGVSRVIC